MARGKRTHVENVKETKKASKEVLVEDKETEIGEKMDEHEDVEIDNDSSDSSVYSDLDEGSTSLLKSKRFLSIEYHFRR